MTNKTYRRYRQQTPLTLLPPKPPTAMLTHNVAAEWATNEPFQGLAPLKPNKPSMSREDKRTIPYREKKETIKLKNPSTTTPTSQVPVPPANFPMLHP
jgi:hypothetical protein